MNRARQAKLWLALFAGAQLICGCLLAQSPAPPLPAARSFSTPTNILPPMPQFQSPVSLFRQLLAMSPLERNQYLTNRPPEIRERILAKLHEYQALPPDERELRLRATELHWCLLPLLHMAPTNRAARLAQAPDDLRDLVKARLAVWDNQPPQLQQEFLDNERASRYFTRVDSTNIPPPQAEQDRWNSLSDAQRQQVTEQFNQYFNFTPAEKQQVLNSLSGDERKQMEKTLQSFDKLTVAQRATCLRNFKQFAGMSAAEREEFLKNAERWSQMSPAERQTWRDLVTHVPLWPPLPPSLPPMPPKIPPHAHPVVATNLGLSR